MTLCKILFSTLLFISFHRVQGQTKAVTETGEEVLLAADGTWRYVEAVKNNDSSPWSAYTCRGLGLRRGRHTLAVASALTSHPARSSKKVKRQFVFPNKWLMQAFLLHASKPTPQPSHANAWCFHQHCNQCKLTNCSSAFFYGDGTDHFIRV